ncbi:MAG TPA: bifunctional riboflavin kinase/FAD synthetase [Chthoniobacterales bacterium]|jgi:riboflavin kinase/FMN adenylyltransferase|nr:bifunctional riboflavin kinase/FAD synthetase [Chthoniobacterales bacterium]
MRVLRSIPELAQVPGPVFLAIGVFDGVHRGHQAVISTATRDAKEAGGTAVVVTFDPHPAKILRPDKTPRLLTATPHKVALIRALGVSHLLVLTFDRDLAATAPDDFVRQLVAAANPLHEVCVGQEWSFGKNRAGNLALLKELGAQLDFNVVGVEPVTSKGEIISSTAIRRAVETGDFETAARMLGRDYTILGTVEEGKHLGKSLGFPTANLSAHSEQFPPNGVYAAEGSLDGQTLRGVVNLGVRPTIAGGSPQRVLEFHIFDLDRDLYGKEIEMRFLRYLRPEQKFENLGALREQIGRDVAKAREVFATN